MADIELENNLDIEIDIDSIIDGLISNPDFINQVILAITKQVRSKGNAFGIWAQKQPAPVVNPPKGTKRLN